MPDPAAFFSYAHADDEHDGALTRLHAALEQEIGLQLGADFTLFIDRDDIVWGESWRAIHVDCVPDVERRDNVTD